MAPNDVENTSATVDAPVKFRDAEQRRVDQRVAAAQTVHDERSDEDGRAEQRGQDRRRRRPAPVAAFDQPERQRADPAGRPGPRRSASGRGPRARESPAAGAIRRPSPPAPMGTLTRNTQRQSRATSRPPITGPSAAATPPHGSPRAHRCTPTLGRIAWRAPARARSGSAGPHRPPARRGSRRASRCRSTRAQATEASVKISDAEQETPLAPVPVGQAPEQHQQRGVDDRVGVEHPRERHRGSARSGRWRSSAGPR